MCGDEHVCAAMPLAALAAPWFYEPASAGRQDWGQDLFHFDTPSYDNYFAAREFLCEMAEFWVSKYHVDGFRIDDFADINNWDFIQEFHDRATAKSQALFPGKPFLVVAEDSNRRFVTTADDSFNPGGRKVVDAIWNFGYRDEIRRLVTPSTLAGANPHDHSASNTSSRRMVPGMSGITHLIPVTRICPARSITSLHTTLPMGPA
jgi:glycosidase